MSTTFDDLLRNLSKIVGGDGSAHEPKPAADPNPTSGEAPPAPTMARPTAKQQPAAPGRPRTKAKARSGPVGPPLTGNPYPGGTEKQVTALGSVPAGSIRLGKYTSGAVAILCPTCSSSNRISACFCRGCQRSLGEAEVAGLLTAGPTARWTAAVLGQPERTVPLPWEATVSGLKLASLQGTLYCWADEQAVLEIVGWGTPTQRALGKVRNLPTTDLNGEPLVLAEDGLYRLGDSTRSGGIELLVESKLGCPYPAVSLGSARVGWIERDVKASDDRALVRRWSPGIGEEAEIELSGLGRIGLPTALSDGTMVAPAGTGLAVVPAGGGPVRLVPTTKDETPDLGRRPVVSLDGTAVFLVTKAGTVLRWRPAHPDGLEVWLKGHVGAALVPLSDGSLIVTSAAGMYYLSPIGGSALPIVEGRPHLEPPVRIGAQIATMEEDPGGQRRVRLYDVAALPTAHAHLVPPGGGEIVGLPMAHLGQLVVPVRAAGRLELRVYPAS